MRDFYDVSRRAELLGREHVPHWTFQEFLGAFRSEDSGERQQLFAAYDEVLWDACRALNVPTELDRMTDALERESERLRTEHELERAGVDLG